MKLNICRDLYNTEELRVAYIGSLLIGDASDCAYTKHTLDGALHYGSAEELLSSLAQTFGNLHRNGVARKLSGLWHKATLSSTPICATGTAN